MDLVLSDMSHSYRRFWLDMEIQRDQSRTTVSDTSCKKFSAHCENVSSLARGIYPNFIHRFLNNKMDRVKKCAVAFFNCQAKCCLA